MGYCPAGIKFRKDKLYCAVLDSRFSGSFPGSDRADGDMVRAKWGGADECLQRGGP